MSLIWLGLFLAGFAFLSYKKPVWGLGALLALAPTYLIRFEILGLPTTLLEVMLAVFLLMVAGAHVDKQALYRIRNLGTINVWIWLFVVAGIIAVIVSPETTRALGQLKAFIIEPILLFYAIVALKSQEGKLNPALGILFGGASLVALFGIVQYYTHLFLPLRFWGNGEEVKRIVSVFEYPNALALYLAPLFVLFLVLKIKNYSLSQSAWFNLGLIIQAIALMMTFSRGAWLAVIVATGFVLIKNLGWKKIASGLAVLLILFAAVAPIRQRILGSSTDASGTARMELMRTAGQKISQSPLVGNGLYGFRTTLEERKFQGEILNYPHNIVLNFWLEMGLLGVISFFMIVFWPIKNRLGKTGVLGLAAASFMLAIVVHGLVDVPYFKNDLAILFWFALSLFYAEN